MADLVPICTSRLAPARNWARCLASRMGTNVDLGNDDGCVLGRTSNSTATPRSGGVAGREVQYAPECGWPFITITPRKCDPKRPPSDEDIRIMEHGQRVSFSRIAGHGWYADWCGDGVMFIQVESPDRQYVEAAAQGLRVRDVSIACV